MRVDAVSGTRLLYNLRFRAILYQVIAVGSIVILGFICFPTSRRNWLSRTLPQGLIS